MSFRSYLPDDFSAGSLSSPAFASHLDAALDACVPSLRHEFALPHTEAGALRRAVGAPVVYLCGNSLGLMPRRTRAAVTEELDKWERFGVEGHFRSAAPWVSIEDTVVPLAAALVGASPSEVAIMSGLTGNLHTAMDMFYKPELPPRPAGDDVRRPRGAAELAGCRYKILTEGRAFPSDTYAVKSQLARAGICESAGLVEVCPRPGETLLRNEDIIAAIAAEGDALALVLFSGVQVGGRASVWMPALLVGQRNALCLAPRAAA